MLSVFFVIPYWNSIHSKTALDLLNQLLGLHRFTMTVLQIIEDPIMFHILGKPPF